MIRSCYASQNMASVVSVYLIILAVLLSHKLYIYIYIYHCVKAMLCIFPP